jgi:AraC-like DNA-binding protein
MTTLLLLLILHGLFLAGLVLLPEAMRGAGRQPEQGRGQGSANRLLAALLLVVSMLLLESYLERTGLALRWPHLRGTLRPLWFLVGPLCLLYVRRSLGFPVGARAALLAIVPAALAGVGLVPYFRLPAETKAKGLEFPGGTAAALLLFLGFSALTGWCAWRSRDLLRRAQRSAAAPDPATAPWRLGWLRWLMGLLATYAVLDFWAALVLLLRGSYPPAVGVASLLMLTSLIYGTGLLVALPDGLLARAPWPGRRYAHSGLPRDYVAARLHRLERLMGEEKPWLDDRLSLDRLARLLGTSRHVLSQILNESLGTTFNDFVNRYRVREAQRLLLDMGSRKSITDLGLEAGFGSSATFYRAFKKECGTTPTDFLLQAAAGRVAPLESRSQQEAG